MNTKSTIQIIGETIVAKNKFFEHLEELYNKYDIVDSVFCCDEHGLVQECDRGYFGEVAVYESLNDARANFNIFNQGIRVKKDKFIVGHLYKALGDVKEDKIIDLTNSTVIAD